MQHRRAGTENDKLPTGAIEVRRDGGRGAQRREDAALLHQRRVDVDETLRLRYRYLDLRRERMHNNIVLRHRVVQ